MSQHGKILVPVKRSSGSRAALRHAARLARQTGSSIHVLHVWELPDYLHPDTLVHRPGDRRVAVSDIAWDEMAAIRAMVAEEAPELQVVELLEYGQPGQVILDIAAAGRFELIVVGASRKPRDRGRRAGLPELLAHEAGCPVLLVPEPAAGRPERVVAPLLHSR